jgi:hypothetical protein
LARRITITLIVSPPSCVGAKRRAPHGARPVFV